MLELYGYCIALVLGTAVGFTVRRRRLLIILAALLLGVFWIGIDAEGEQRVYFALTLGGYLAAWAAGVFIGSSLRKRWSRMRRSHRLESG